VFEKWTAPCAEGRHPNHHTPERKNVMELIAFVREWYSWLIGLPIAGFAGWLTKLLWNHREAIREHILFWRGFKDRFEKMERSVADLRKPDTSGMRCCGIAMAIARTEPRVWEFTNEPMEDQEWVYWQCQRRACYRHSNFLKVPMAGVTEYAHK
jgi:hypothetical protein